MSLTVRCTVCREELDEPGAVVFSPPVDDECRKYHICVLCWPDSEPVFLRPLPGTGSADV